MTGLPWDTQASEIHKWFAEYVPHLDIVGVSIAYDYGEDAELIEKA
jgi:hypothetical protein